MVSYTMCAMIILSWLPFLYIAYCTAFPLFSIIWVDAVGNQEFNRRVGVPSPFVYWLCSLILVLMCVIIDR